MLIPTFILAFLLLTKKTSFEKYFSKEALEKLNIKNNHLNNTQRTIILFVAITFMIISLARPVINEKEQEFKQKTISYIIAIDVSKSMLAKDITPNRLEFAKQKALELIDDSKEKAVGVILFSNSSYILSPLTQDFISLKTLVHNLDLSLNFDNGSSIISALKTSKKLLKNSTSKNIILLTDGSDKNSFTNEIEYAKDNKLKIYTITTAKEKSPILLEDGKYLTNQDGNIVTVGLNEQIKELSFQTNGAYINYTLNQKDINSILNELTKNSIKDNIASKKFKTYTELFYYPLILTLILLLIAFSSLPKIRKTLPLFLLCFFNYETNASIMDFQTIDNATSAYENKEYKKAVSEFSKLNKNDETNYNLANSLYKEKKYKEALNTYKKIQTSNKELEYKKLHNLGNSYTKINDFENAVKMYENALKIKNDLQTKENLKLVKDALKNKKKNQEKNKKNNKSKKDKKKNSKKKEDQKQNTQKKKEKQGKEEKKSSKKGSGEKSKKKDQNKLNKEKSQQEISDIEEKKWLNQLKNQKMKVLLKKDVTGEEKKSIKQQW